MNGITHPTNKQTNLCGLVVYLSTIYLSLTTTVSNITSDKYLSVELINRKSNNASTIEAYNPKFILLRQKPQFPNNITDTKRSSWQKETQQDPNRQQKDIRPDNARRWTYLRNFGTPVIVSRRWCAAMTPKNKNSTGFDHNVVGRGWEL